MSRAGMSFQQILASLTTNPPQRFGYSTRRGRIAEGMDGDLVILRADPAQALQPFPKCATRSRAGHHLLEEVKSLEAREIGCSIAQS